MNSIICYLRLSAFFILLLEMNCLSATRQVTVQGRPAQNAQAPADNQQLAVVPAPAAAARAIIEQQPRTTWQWIKENWKPTILITGVITVGAVCGYLASKPDPLPPTFPGSNCIIPVNVTDAQHCYTLTVHNCGKCSGNIPSQTRCGSNSMPQINPLALKAACESPDFQACLEDVPCSSSAQPVCIPDNFSQYVTYLNQTCTLKEKSANINRFRKRSKRVIN